MTWRRNHDGRFLNTLSTLTLGSPRKGLPFLEPHPGARLCHSPRGLGLGSLAWPCRISLHIHSGLNLHGLPSLLVVYGNLQAVNSCWWLIMSPSYLCVCFLLESLKLNIWSVVKGWSAEITWGHLPVKKLFGKTHIALNKALMPV